MSTDRCKLFLKELPEKGYTVAFLSGTLNLFNARQIRQELEPLLQHDVLRLAFDLDELEAIDSSGIGSLVNFVLASRKHANARVVFTRIRPMVMHILEVTKLKSFFSLAEDDTEVLNQLSR